MRSLSVSFISMLVILAVLVGGCAFRQTDPAADPDPADQAAAGEIDPAPTQEPSPEPTPEPTPEPSPDAAPEAARGRVEPQTSGLCYNPFYPIRSDTVWTYRITGSTYEEDDFYTLTYGEITEDYFQAEMTLEDDETGEFFQVESEWYCGEDGIISSEMAFVTLLTVADLEFDTLDYEGIYLLPADQWAEGASWDASYQVRAKVSFEGTTLEADMVVEILNTISAVEEITVTAGTYPEAYRVDTTGTMNMKLEGDFDLTRGGIPIEFSTWYVENVGMVKQITSAVDAGGGYTELYAIE